MDQKKLSAPFIDDPRVQHLSSGFTLYNANLYSIPSNLTGNIRKRDEECEPGYEPVSPRQPTTIEYGLTRSSAQMASTARRSDTSAAKKIKRKAVPKATPAV